MQNGGTQNRGLSQQQNSQTQPDSKTSDVRHISVHDDRLTVRINSRLKQAFLGHCRAKGQSACHILEGMLYGYLEGFYDKIELDVKSPTINLTLVRDVKRVRRYAVEIEEKESEAVTMKQLVEQQKLVSLGKYFKMVADQWDLHPKREWREKTKKKALEWIGRAPNAELVLALAGKAGDSDE